MKLAFFGYAWNPQLQTDAYMSETIDSLARTGAEVDIYLGGQLSSEHGIYGVKDTVSLDTLQRFIAAQNYDAAISFNNSMLIPQVMEALHGRVVTVIVDEPEHLFDHLRTGPWDVFRQDVEIFAMSSVLERRIREHVKDVDARLHFTLPATHIGPEARGAAPTYPISWVASYVGDHNLDLFLKLASEAPEYHALTVKCLDLVARDGDLRSVKAEDGADAALIRNLPWTFDYFQTQMQNILTNRSRVAVVERLASRGLALFGNANWRKLLTHNAAVLQALQSGPTPATHADLRRVYNASTISINLPQAHVTNDAVQYRVIDVMASNALMITQYSPTSDLYRVFGADCPIPTYRDLDELERLCVHFLNNEAERLALVERCNALVATGFSFDDRSADYLRSVGLAMPVSGAPGALRRIDLALFSKEA
jgi:Glycosyl transferases group 1